MLESWYLETPVFTPCFGYTIDIVVRYFSLFICPLSHLFTVHSWSHWVYDFSSTDIAQISFLFHPRNSSILDHVHNIPPINCDIPLRFTDALYRCTTIHMAAVCWFYLLESTGHTILQGPRVCGVGQLTGLSGGSSFSGTGESFQVLVKKAKFQKMSKF